MHRPGRLQSGVAYALALLMAITGLAGLVGVTTSSASARNSSTVWVSCSQAFGGGTTECVVSAPGADELAVPAGNVCAAFTATSGAWNGSAYVSAPGTSSISFSYESPVVIDGGGLYQVTAGGVTSDVFGQAIVCAEVSLPQESGETSGTSEAQSTEPPATTEIGGGAGEPSVEQPAGTDAATTEANSSTPETTDSGSEDEAVNPASVIVDPETTPETGVPATPARVTIVAYLCDVDPGTADPATAGCALAPNVNFAASDSGGGLGTATTDGSGVTGFDSTTGSTFIVQQTTVVDGYRPTGDGRYEVQQLAGDLTITVVNVLRVELGRLQIVAGLCPTSGESRTEFTIADQSHVQTASLTECGANPGSVFTITSDALPGGSWTIRTEADGAWRGYVPAGTYTVTASDGTVSDPIVVIADAVSVAVAVSYIHQDQGTLDLQHVLCTAGVDGEYIAVNPAGAPDASCSPARANITLADELAGTSTTILVSDNGSTPVALKPGLYRVTGPAGIASDLVTITAEQTSVVRVSTVATVGSVMIHGKLCPAGNGTAPANPAATCTAVAGQQSVTLAGPGGSQTITTSSSGTTSVNGLALGSYSLGGATVCAVRDADGNDASNFTVSGGQTTSLTVYHCPIDDGTGGGQNGGGTSGPGNGDGTGGNTPPLGNSGGSPDDGTNPNLNTGGVGGDGPDADGTGGTAVLGIYASNSHLLVRGLPAAGSGSTAPSDFWWPILLLTGAGGLALIGRRQQKLAKQRIRRDR